MVSGFQMSTARKLHWNVIRRTLGLLRWRASKSHSRCRKADSELVIIHCIIQSTNKPPSHLNFVVNDQWPVTMTGLSKRLQRAREWEGEWKRTSEGKRTWRTWKTFCSGHFLVFNLKPRRNAQVERSARFALPIHHPTGTIFRREFRLNSKLDSESKVRRDWQWVSEFTARPSRVHSESTMTAFWASVECEPGT